MQLTTTRVRMNSREVKRIYFEAFPKQERMPFPLMVAMSWLWNTQVLSFAREGRVQGFVYLARGLGVVFVMFLAVDGALRGQGCGSAILQDGKIIGAVTHVLLDDPSRGYGIFIENMLSAAGLSSE